MNYKGTELYILGEVIALNVTRCGLVDLVESWKTEEKVHQRQSSFRVITGFHYTLEK